MYSRPAAANHLRQMHYIAILFYGSGIEPIGRAGRIDPYITTTVNNRIHRYTVTRELSRMKRSEMIGRCRRAYEVAEAITKGKKKVNNN